MADALKKVPVREQDPAVRAKNFEEVCYGYNKEEAMEEASRCINCKNAKCVEGCPVSIDIPGFISKVKEGAFEEAYRQKHSENHMWDRRWGIVEVNRMSLKTHTGVNYKEQLLPGVGKQGQYTKELDRGKVFEENREKTTAVRVDLSEHLI